MVILGLSMSSIFCGRRLNMAMAAPLFFEKPNASQQFLIERFGRKATKNFLRREDSPPVSVIKLQVGLKADKDIQEDLDRIDATTDTLNFLLQGKVDGVDQLTVDGRKNIEKAEKRFSKLYKALKQTTHTVIAENADASSEKQYTVVTILVVAIGEYINHLS